VHGLGRPVDPDPARPPRLGGHEVVDDQRHPVAAGLDVLPLSCPGVPHPADEDRAVRFDAEADRGVVGLSVGADRGDPSERLGSEILEFPLSEGHTVRTFRSPFIIPSYGPLTARRHGRTVGR
jgi:hypothetical protein